MHMNKPICTEHIVPQRFIFHLVKQFHAMEKEKLSHLFNENLKLCN